MIKTILNDEYFIALMQKHCYEVLNSLIENKQEFSIVTNTNFVDFDPPLPPDLDVKKNPYTLFSLAGYTFDSLELHKDFLLFHAGFGPQDYASFVKVDLGAIAQIQIENHVLFVNFSLYKRKDETEIQKSKNIFLNNPKNKDLFKK
ncbi:hypothetical protein OQH60_00085 [Campylobacter sp. MIT 21-1685]|uniref:hypothetical protein n=1 Tax=unclassified Campylobacter TaxID=2593542 RepID=UPI00224ADFA1|nr:MULTISPECIES: hypothetical protein [unclassified Campylobacter]MCX2682416.1 hypothetical protein [Campylobacter sp. MIT 21-1684]MCX2750696.1 hypothetical protein [Campylobacter sp. MIT 21-1682]MCX2806756.1 hypothetical protein [Campylobacter sp. MIT 21-1685]